MMDDTADGRIARLWWLVLLRGLVPGMLALILFMTPELSLQGAAWAVAGVALLGSALELVVVWRLRGVMPRGVYWLTALMGLAFGGIVLAAATTTLVLMLIVVGAWLGVRGLAALWVALSMRHRTKDWLLPLAVAFLSSGAGVMLMFSGALEIGSLVVPAVAYALCYAALHAAAAWRLRRAPGQWILRRG